ncbi:MAG TPA: DUF4340 domain-containing protein [Pseudomonadota bacterium]|nr:DUF4340 domain-containing protein [Pseudomonadota bacterium]
MEKKTVYALIALLVLGGLSVYVMRAPEKGDRVGERPRPLPEIKAGSIAQVELTQPKGADKVTLSKKGDKWQVTAPYDKPADQAAVKSVVEALEKMKWGDITTQQKERHGELEVSDDKAVHVIAKDSGGGVLADLYLGKVAGSSTMVRVAGKDEVWQVADLYASNFKKEGKSWREHTVFDLKADEAEKLTLKGGGTQIKLERLPPQNGPDGKPQASIFEAKWKVVESDPALKLTGELDNSLINRLVQGAAALRAGDFLDTAKPEETGLAPGAPGQIEVQVGFKDNKSVGLRIGQLKGDDYYAQAIDSGQIFTVKKYALDAVAHIPQDLRDKSILSFKEDQLDQITVAQGADVAVLKHVDKVWKVDKLADGDENKAKGVASSFDTLTGAGYVAPGSPELASLAKPRATVTLKPKTGAPVVLNIGDARGEDVVVQKVGQDPMWLNKSQVERFLKKPAELAKDKK